MSSPLASCTMDWGRIRVEAARRTLQDVLKRRRGSAEGRTQTHREGRCCVFRDHYTGGAGEGASACHRKRFFGNIPARTRSAWHQACRAYWLCERGLSLLSDVCMLHCTCPSSAAPVAIINSLRHSNTRTLRQGLLAGVSVRSAISHSIVSSLRCFSQVCFQVMPSKNGNLFTAPCEQNVLTAGSMISERASLTLLGVAAEC